MSCFPWQRIFLMSDGVTSLDVGIACLTTDSYSENASYKESVSNFGYVYLTSN
jgi:hypothetical protein